MTTSVLTTLMGIVLLVPVVMLPLAIAVAMLTGRMSLGGLWRDSFDLQAFSVSRLYQSLAVLTVAGTTLMGVAANGATAFPPIPGWLLALAGGGDAVYLGAKWLSSRKQGK
jgi:hypothetical protein